MAGLSATGFTPKLLAEILADMETVELAEISASLDLQPTALMGVLNGIIAQQLADLWLLATALYNGMDPDQATGDQLASLALLTGTPREAATKTQVDVTANVDAGFSALPGTMFASVVGNPVAQFTNKETVASGGGGNVTTAWEAVNAGAVQCLAGTLTVIAVPLAGWNTVTNAADGVIGSPIETDSSLRTRRVQELQGAGSTTAAAIYSDVLLLMQPPTTTSATVGVTVLYNDTDATDANGLPPHSIEVIADQPGATADDDTALCELILDDKAAGIETYGTDSTVVVDSQGNSQTVYFSRPTDVPIYIELTVVTDPNTFPLDGSTQIKEAIAAYGAAAWQPGSTVYALHTRAQCFGGQVLNGATLFPQIPGVLDVTVFKIDDVDPPVGTTNVTVTVRQKASVSTGDIDVTVV